MTRRWSDVHPDQQTVQAQESLTLWARAGHPLPGFRGAKSLLDTSDPSLRAPDNENRTQSRHQSKDWSI